MTRYIFTWLFICSVTMLHAQSSAEEIRINKIFYRAPLSSVLKTIQEEYNIKVAYDNTLVQNIIVALHLNNLSLSESFERLLENTSLTFQKVGDNIIILPKPKESAVSIPENKDIRLSGNIMDADTEETLPQATISIRGTNISVTSNNDGNFTILAIPHDTCTVIVRYLGYITQTIPVRNIDNSGRYTIRLKGDTQILNEVVVFDEYNQAIHVEEQPGSSVFNPKSLSTLPSLGEQDISRTLQLIPGVTATDESSSGMVIRGSHPSYNLTLLDGMTIYQQDHFFGSFSIINADVIKDVHVHKGMFNAKYGGRVSGVIDITTKNGNTVKPSFNIKVNSISAKGIAEIPLAKKWSLFVGARRSFTDAFRSNLYTNLFEIAQTSNDQIGMFRFFEGDEYGTTPDYHFFDINTKLSFKPSDRDIFSLSLYTSRDKMHIATDISIVDDPFVFTLDNKEITRWGNNGLSFRWGRQWSNRYYSNIRISDSRFFRTYDYRQKVVENTNLHSYTLEFENDVSDLTYALDNEWLINDKLSFNWGFLGTYQQTYIQVQDRFIYSGDDPPDEVPEDIDSTRNAFSWQHSLYGSVIVSPINKLTLSVGSRFVYYFNHTDQLFFEPRLTARYKITEQLNLKTGYARSNQFISQLFYYSPTGSISGISENFWMLSEPNSNEYPVISSDHISAGATWKRKQIAFDAEVFFKVSSGIIIDEDINSGDTDMYGLEFMIQKTNGIHRGWIAYSLSRANQSHPDIQNGRSTPTWQDQRHEFKAVNMLMLGDWNFSSSLIFGSGKPYPRYTVMYYRDEMDMIDDYGVQLDYSNQSRLPAYFRVDLAASYKVRFKKSGEMLIGLSIHNVTDHKNIKTRRINTEKLSEAILTNTELPPTYSDVVLLGFTPTLSISFSF